MDRKFPFLLLMVLFFSISCKKDEIPNVEPSQPVFNYSLILEEQIYLLSAGESNLSLLPTTIISDSSLVFTSALADQSCVSCGPAFAMTITAPQEYIFNGSAMLLDDFGDWEFSFKNIVDSIKTLDMMLSSGNSQIHGFWFLDQMSLSVLPIPEISITLDNPGSYRIEFDSETPDCSNAADLGIAFDGNANPCYGNIYRPSAGVDSFYVNLSSTFDIPSINFRWFYGDSTLAENNFNFFSNNLSGFDSLCVEVSDSGNCSIVSCIELDNLPTTCQPNITVQAFLQQTQPIPNEFAQVSVEFTDFNGMVYTTVDANQENSSFDLFSAVPYSDPGFPNEFFAKLDLQIQCNVIDQTGTTYSLSGLVQTAIKIP